mmetsp:Transcript_130859/g.230559  ORF Transcript_130859/g.230559 Transcript_130859/m.230559 type:complete len:200 (+) Transcript_130859:1-600(+)
MISNESIDRVTIQRSSGPLPLVNDRFQAVTRVDLTLNCIFMYDTNPGKYQQLTIEFHSSDEAYNFVRHALCSRFSQRTALLKDKAIFTDEPNDAIFEFCHESKSLKKLDGNPRSTETSNISSGLMENASSSSQEHSGSSASSSDGRSLEAPDTSTSRPSKVRRVHKYNDYMNMERDQLVRLMLAKDDEIADLQQRLGLN